MGLKRRGLAFLDFLGGIRVDGSDRAWKPVRVGGLVVAATISFALGAWFAHQDADAIRHIEARGISVPGVVVENQIDRSGDGPDTLLGVCVRYSYEASDYRECPNADHSIPVGARVTLKLLPDRPNKPVIVGDASYDPGLSAGLFLFVGFLFLVWTLSVVMWGPLRRSWKGSPTDREAQRHA